MHSAREVQLGVLVNRQEIAIKTDVHLLHRNLHHHHNGHHGHHVVLLVEEALKEDGKKERTFLKPRDAISKLAKPTQSLVLEVLVLLMAYLQLG